jgi:TonB family protein
MATVTAHFRIYELPWTASNEEQGRLRRWLTICFSVIAVVCILLPLLPVPTRTVDTVEPVPPRLAKLVLEREVKPPPPAPPPPKIDPIKKPTDSRPVPTPQPVDRAAEARRKAVQAAVALDQKNLTTTVGEQTRSERSLLTSKVGASSGGINTAGLSRGYGGSTGALSGHTTTTVNSAVLEQQANDSVRRAAGSGKASRSEEEIALVFDRNKGAIYALYTRALRDKPDLQGKVVLELTIGADGSIERCEIVSSELNDPELERKLVARVKSFRFEARDVGTITVTKPIDFFPA